MSIIDRSQSSPFKDYTCALVVNSLLRHGTHATGEVILQAAEYRAPAMLSKNAKLPALLTLYQQEHPDSLIFSPDLLTAPASISKTALTQELEKIDAFIQAKTNDTSIESTKSVRRPRSPYAKARQKETPDKEQRLEEAKAQLDAVQHKGRVENPELIQKDNGRS